MTATPPATPRALAPGAVVGFVGLGAMGQPMTARLLAAGYRVRGYDRDRAARDRFAAGEGAVPVDSVTEVARGAAAVVAMLPDSAAVASVLADDDLLGQLPPEAVLVDMGSSEPLRTRELAAHARERGITMIDAPVSGGVPGARAGTLTVMAGGPPEVVAAVEPMLAVFGRTVRHVGPVGAGHALKALNNLLSATHLLASSEAMLVGQEFGLDPTVMLEVLNTSSGRSGSTENKWPNYMVNRRFGAGFGIRLMVKDLRIAVGLAEEVGWPCQLGAVTTGLWAQAADHLPDDADHTEIVRWLEATHDQDTFRF